MTDQVRVEVAFPPTLHDFLLDDSPVRAIVGPFGSGKSTVCVFELLRRSAEQKQGPDGLRRTRWAIVRNTYPQLRDTTRKTFEDWARRAKVEQFITWHEASFTAELVIGDIRAEFLFRALDRPGDVAKLLSLELTGAWLNEAREIPKAIFDAIQGRVTRFPAMDDGGPTWAGVILDTNPPDTDHWFYTLFEEVRPEGHRLFHQPSGLSPQAENVEHHYPGYYQRMMAGKDPEWIRVYVEGQYGFVRDGRPIYPEFKDNLHVAEVEPYAEGDIIVGQDFGLTPAAVLVQRSHMDGQLQVFDELVSEDMGAANFARELATKLKREFPNRNVSGFGDPAGEQRAQTDERTPFDVVRAAGLPLFPAPTNDFTLRREAVAGLLGRLTMLGRPALVVSPRCKVLRKAMSGGYCYRRLQVVGADKYADKPDKNKFSHVAEALQYAVVGLGEDQRVVAGTNHRSALSFKAIRSL